MIVRQRPLPKFVLGLAGFLLIYADNLWTTLFSLRWKCHLRWCHLRRCHHALKSSASKQKVCSCLQMCKCSFFIPANAAHGGFQLAGSTLAPSFLIKLQVLNTQCVKGCTRSNTHLQSSALSYPSLPPVAGASPVSSKLHKPPSQGLLVFGLRVSRPGWLSMCKCPPQVLQVQQP